MEEKTITGRTMEEKTMEKKTTKEKTPGKEETRNEESGNNEKPKTKQKKLSQGESISQQFDEFEKSKLFKETYDAVFAHYKRQFQLIVAVVIGIMGLLFVVTAPLVIFGIGGLVNSVIESEIESKLEIPINDANEKISDVNEKLVRTKIALEYAEELVELVKEARKEIAGYSHQIESLQEETESLQEARKQLKVAFQKAKQELHGLITNTKSLAELNDQKTNDQLKKLEKLVTDIASKSNQNRSALREYKEELKELKSKSADKTSQFTQNSRYEVSVVFSPKNKKRAQEVTATLATIGFKTSLLKFEETFLSDFYSKIYLNSKFPNGFIYGGSEEESKLRRIKDNIFRTLKSNQLTVLGKKLDFGNDGTWENSTISVVLP